jgi:hypothetical protein
MGAVEKASQFWYKKMGRYQHGKQKEYRPNFG